MKKPKAAYVTYRVDPEDPDIDHDIGIFLEALRVRGLDPSPVIWDDPRVDWASFDLVLIRSTWDYTRNLEKFLDWAERVSKVTRLENPFEILKENTDKRYLRRLEISGIPIVPTLFLENPLELDRTFADNNSAWVTKPVVDAGARKAVRHTAWDEVEKTVRKHFSLSNLPLMLQPYLDEVDTDGEIAVACCLGEPTHAVIKRPALSDGGHGDFAAIAELTGELSAFVKTVLSRKAGSGQFADLLYARVDVVPRGNGYLLMELEATEPCLFLAQAEKALDVFAGAVAGSLGMYKGAN